MPGLGLAKYNQLAATRELAERAMAERLFAGDVMNSPDVVRAIICACVCTAVSGRCFVALCLSAQNQVLAMEELCVGNLADQSRVYPRARWRSWRWRATPPVIIATIIPSGSAGASEADIQLTRQLGQALALIDASARSYSWWRAIRRCRLPNKAGCARSGFTSALAGVLSISLFTDTWPVLCKNALSIRSNSAFSPTAI